MPPTARAPAQWGSALAIRCEGSVPVVRSSWAALLCQGSSGDKVQSCCSMGLSGPGVLPGHVLRTLWAHSPEGPWGKGQQEGGAPAGGWATCV